MIDAETEIYLQQVISRMTDAMTSAAEDYYLRAFALLSNPETVPDVRAARARRASLRPRDAERGWWFSIRRGDRRRHVIDHVHYRSVRPASDLTIREAIAAADELRTSDPLGEACSKSATDVMAAAAGEGTLVFRDMTWPGIG